MDDGRDTPASPPPPQLLEVAPLAVLPAPATRTPAPLLPWVHLWMHDKEMNKENAHMMYDAKMRSKRDTNKV
jgi:hypothetical protein